MVNNSMHLSQPKLALALTVWVLLMLIGCDKPAGEQQVLTADKSIPTPAPSAPDYSWVELGPNNIVLARAIVAAGNDCPDINLDSNTDSMQSRGASPTGFSEVQLCEYAIPANTASASINGQQLVLPVSNPTTIVVVGDTGCRVKGTDIQDCTGNGTGELWDYAEVADAIAKINPDLIIHVGDYHYREYGSCDANCIQSNIGYTWVSWKVDFFDPSKNILAQAPWVFVRGNHEDCTRAWRGWFYFLDPNALPDNPWVVSNCSAYTDPYLVSAGHQDLIVMDSATIPDDYAATPNPAAVARYAKEFNQVESLVSGSTSAWLSTHRPIWGIAGYIDNDGNPAISATDLTLQQAIAQSNTKQLPNPPIEMLLTGHVHLFEMLTLTNGRPSQWVFGGGGTELDPGITNQLLDDNPQVLTELGITRQDVNILHDISFGVMEQAACGWNVTIKNSQGNDIGSFACQ